MKFTRDSTLITNALKCKNGHKYGMVFCRLSIDYDNQNTYNYKRIGCCGDIHCIALPKNDAMKNKIGYFFKEDGECNFTNPNNPL